MPYFIYRDYVNEVTIKGRAWEVANPLVFSLLLRASQQWTLVHPETFLETMYYTILDNIATPFGGNSKVAVVCKIPGMFEELRSALKASSASASSASASSASASSASASSALSNWWFKYGRTPILISTPFYINAFAPNFIHLVSIRSQYKMVPKPESSESSESKWVPELLMEGGYTVASGQTMILGLHRAKRIHKEPILNILKEWVEAYQYLKTESMLSYWNPYLQWYMTFDAPSLQMLTYIKTNALIGDQLAYYASHSHTDPEVLTFLFSNATLTPLIGYVQNTNHRILYTSHYSKWIQHTRNPWELVVPFLEKMSVKSLLREDGDDRDDDEDSDDLPYYLSPLNDETYRPFAIQFKEGIDPEQLTAKIQWIQSEYNMTLVQVAFKLFMASFETRTLPKRVLVAYWEYIYHKWVQTEERWTYLMGYLLYHYYFRPVEMPWLFLHWAFDVRRRIRLHLCLKINYQIPRFSTAQTLLDILRTFRMRPETTIAMYIEKVFKPTIRERLRTVYQIRRDWVVKTGGTELVDVFTAYFKRHPAALIT